MNSDTNDAAYVSTPNANGQQKFSFRWVLLPICDGSLLKFHLCQHCGKVLSTCDDNPRTNCMLHVLKFFCFNNRKKLQCISHKRNYFFPTTGSFAEVV